MFKDGTEQLGDGKVNKDRVFIFGLLNCVESNYPPIEKVKSIFYNLTEKGVRTIDSDNAKLKSTLKIMMNQVSKDLFDAAEKVADIEAVYTEGDIAKIDDDCFEELYETFISDVFGVNKALKFEEWTKNVTQFAPWLFNPTEFRTRIADWASIQTLFLE